MLVLEATRPVHVAKTLQGFVAEVGIYVIK
jgi:hypothetical protein